jgi:hypothetical protein
VVSAGEWELAMARVKLKTRIVGIALKLGRADAAGDSATVRRLAAKLRDMHRQLRHLRPPGEE